MMGKSLTINVGAAQYNQTLLELVPQIAAVRPGVKLILTKISDDQSDQQRKGFHWLLHQWLVVSPDIRLERLKSNVLTSMFGAARMVDPYGNEHLIPLVRTTQIFDWEIHAYRKKKLTRALYTDLIEHVYRLAAEDGDVLPEMSLEHKAELDREIKFA